MLSFASIAHVIQISQAIMERFTRKLQKPLCSQTVTPSQL